MSSDKIQQILKKAEEYAAKKAELKGNERRRISSGGFWVSPNGDVRPTLNGLYHINDVIYNPEQFGFTREEIESEYDQHGETIGQEGHARDNIMTTVLKRGWIRIRARQNFYSVQVWEFNANTYNNIEKFVTVAIEDGIKGEYSHPYDEMKVNSLKTGKMKSLSFDEVQRGRLYESEETRLDRFYFNR